MINYINDCAQLKRNVWRNLRRLKRSREEEEEKLSFEFSIREKRNREEEEETMGVFLKVMWLTSCRGDHEEFGVSLFDIGGGGEA